MATVNNHELNGWFKLQPKWLQVAANRLLISGNLDDNDISELAGLCTKADNEIPDVAPCIPPNAFGAHSSEKIHLHSISDVTGVNALASHKSLEFGNTNIAVIYGDNGSGKSGYVRLLKHVCGARVAAREPLLGDVFSSEKTAKKATFSFYKNGALMPPYEWTGEVCDALRSVDIFDTLSGKIFRENDGEVSYEPPVLAFFSELVNVCDRVQEKLETNRRLLISKMPKIPNALSETAAATWLAQLNAGTLANEIQAHCYFSAEDETKVATLQKRISEVSPADKAKEMRKKKEHINVLVGITQNYLNQLSDDNCSKIISANKEAAQKKLVAETAATNLFSGANLEGVGSDVWKELWTAAQKYSEEIAYRGKEFPHIEDNAVCVLCHQSLSDEAKQRFADFDSYIKGETQKQAATAQRNYQKLVNDLPDILDDKLIITRLDAGGISDQNITNAIENTIETLRTRKSQVLTTESVDALVKLNCTPEWISKAQEISQSYEERAKQYDVDAKKDNKAQLQAELRNLDAKKWLTDQKQAIQDEVTRQMEYSLISEAIKKTNTRSLSFKKGNLSEMLITRAFIDRFNNELKNLGATNIKVKIVKTRTDKGKTFHAIKLIGATHHPSDILSEGESRIVSIAAFLADVTGKPMPAPFVFDDPISSLDQKYEERMIGRLCSIAQQQQVIIFTHRLSLLGMVQDYAPNFDLTPTLVCVRREFTGAGQPGDIPFFAKKPDSALNKLIDERLSQAKRVFVEEGREFYEPHAASICADFRALVERMVECVLLADVVRRYRRDVHTKNKINKLAIINEADCKYFEDIMTKYSKYVHSHPIETPVALPDLGELESDLMEMKKWLTEFTSR